MTTMVRHLKNEVAKRKKHALEIAGQMQKGLDILATMRNDSKIRYQVQIFDGWPDEEAVTVERKGPLRDAIKSATTTYKTKNKRMDVQARCRVYAIIPGMRPPITLSEQIWKSHFKKFAADETRR